MLIFIAFFHYTTVSNFIARFLSQSHLWVKHIVCLPLIDCLTFIKLNHMKFLFSLMKNGQILAISHGLTYTFHKLMSRRSPTFLWLFKLVSRLHILGWARSCCHLILGNRWEFMHPAVASSPMKGTHSKKNQGFRDSERYGFKLPLFICSLTLGGQLGLFMSQNPHLWNGDKTM